jgi:hypothetical protein
LVDAFIFVVPPSMANPISIWHNRQVNIARCSQWSNATGASPALREKLLRITLPYSCGGRILLASAANEERRRRRNGKQSLFNKSIDLLLFLPGFQDKEKKVPAKLEPLQIDLSLRFVELFDPRLQPVASIHEILQFIGRDHHGILGLGTDVVELLPPVLLCKSEPGPGKAGIPISRCTEIRDRAKHDA